jgi:hypothetical protein
MLRRGTGGRRAIVVTAPMKGSRTRKALGRFDRLHPLPHFEALRRIPR